MSLFEATINMVLDGQEDKKAEILKAADQLLEDAAMEMADSSMNAVCLILLQIFIDGKAPGKATNPLFDQLQGIVAEAGRKVKNDDHSADDTY